MTSAADAPVASVDSAIRMARSITDRERACSIPSLISRRSNPQVGASPERTASLALRMRNVPTPSLDGGASWTTGRGSDRGPVGSTTANDPVVGRVTSPVDTGLVWGLSTVLLLDDAGGNSSDTSPLCVMPSCRPNLLGDRAWRRTSTGLADARKRA